MNVALFCGGRGSSSLIRELARWPGVNLTLIVNAYDDGLSTGAIRRAIPGFLGPSDFRKNLVSSLLQSGEQQLEVAKLMEHRLSINGRQITSILDILSSDSHFNDLWRSFKDSRKAAFENYITKFITYLQREKSIFDFEDCAVGNLIYAGAYLDNNHDFQLANSTLCSLIGVNATIVSISNEETHLVGILENGVILEDESSIVNLDSSHHITQIYLLSRPLSLETLNELNSLSFQEKLNRLESLSKVPEVTKESKSALDQADIIIYGSGTQHSSLLPSYMVMARNGIRPKENVPRIFVANLEWDNDINNWTLETLLKKFAIAWEVKNEDECISHVLIDMKSPLRVPLSHYLKSTSIEFIEANLRNARNPRIHSGFVLNREIQKINHGYKAAKKSGITFVASMNPAQKLRETILRNEIEELSWPDEIELNFRYSNSPEEFLISEYLTWLDADVTRYFIGATGHGQYAMGDVLRALQNMPESMSALTHGNRFQTRNEWIIANKTVFEEKRLNQIIATLGSLVVNLIVTAKFRKSVSDPFSRIFIIDRLALPKDFINFKIENCKSVLGLYAHFWKNSLTTHEFQVKFRATYGESSERKLVKQGWRELWNLMVLK